jgi:hypothetical protein
MTGAQTETYPVTIDHQQSFVQMIAAGCRRAKLHPARSRPSGDA